MSNKRTWSWSRSCFVFLGLCLARLPKFLGYTRCQTNEGTRPAFLLLRGSSVSSRHCTSSFFWVGTYCIHWVGVLVFLFAGRTSSSSWPGSSVSEGHAILYSKQRASRSHYCCGSYVSMSIVRRRTTSYIVVVVFWRVDVVRVDQISYVVVLATYIVVFVLGVSTSSSAGLLKC
jgi:hypothetical protein